MQVFLNNFNQNITFWKIDLNAFFFFSSEYKWNSFQKLHYTANWTHIRLYCDELLLVRYYLFYLCRKQFNQLQACVTEGWLLHTSLYNLINVMKKCFNIHSQKTLWSWPIWQSCCQETTVKSKTMLEGSSGPRHAKSNGIKLFELTNPSSKPLAQIGGFLCSEELVKKLQSPISHQL